MRQLVTYVMVAVVAVPAMAAAVEPERIVPLAPAEEARLERGRMLIQRYLLDDDGRAKYLTVPGKLGTLRAILRVDPLTPGRKDLAEAMGVVMGDTFVQDFGFRWVVLEGGGERRLALRFRRSNIFLYPLDMIAQPARRGERFDVLDLYNGIAADVEERIDALLKP